MSRFGVDNPTALQVIGIVMGVVLSLVLLLALQGWIVMVVFGAVASIFGWSTISFAQGVVVGVALSILGSFFRKS